MVCNFSGKSIIPSAVTFSSDSVYVGRAAVQHEDLKRPMNTIRYIKRLMGWIVTEISEKGEYKLIS